MALELFGKSPAQLQAEATRRDIQLARDAGVVAAVRLEVGSYVTFVGLTNTYRLSCAETGFSQQCPPCADRLAAMVDGYTVFATQTIQNLGWSPQ